MQPLMKEFLIALFLWMFSSSVMGENALYEVISSTAPAYRTGTLLSVSELITLKPGEKITVASTASKSCVETATGPHSDERIKHHGTIFLKSIKCFASQRGEEERHFCFEQPLNELRLYRRDAQATGKFSLLDTQWWDNWVAGEHALAWPLDVLAIEDNSQHRVSFNEIDMTLHFHEIPEDHFSHSEMQSFLREKDCLHQVNGMFELD